MAVSRKAASSELGGVLSRALLGGGKQPKLAGDQTAVCKDDSVSLFRCASKRGKVPASEGWEACETGS
jgi:hypothetical protein